MNRLLLAMTLGDVAGIGPEIVAKAWPKLFGSAKPIVIGEPKAMRAALRLVKADVELQPIANITEAQPDTDLMPILTGTTRDLSDVRVGVMSAAAGGAAYDFLVKAIDLAKDGEIAGIVTCPLHKEGLNAAGIMLPGHTEILAERTGAETHAMLLYDDALPLAVAHVTLHTAIRDCCAGITRLSVLDKIRLLHAILPKLTGKPARIGICALNPHAGDGGLFGDEEMTIIQPAIEDANREGIDASGPWPADAIFLPHHRVKFDGIVAMYHDQGHVAMKLLGGRRAVNITAGLPIVRTSVAHGTAYDIAGLGLADESSLISAVRVAARLTGYRS